MKLVIKYGLIENNIDVTDILIDKNINNIIYIPSGYDNREKLFTNHLKGMLKFIFIYDNDTFIGKYDFLKNIFIDLQTFEIFTDNIPFHICEIFNTKCKTILFTNCRDENNILEWIVHHKNIGFDFIYIIDHKSIIPIKHIINKNIENIHIERNDNEIDKNNNKMVFIDNAISYSKKNKYDWMLYLDADEFLILKDDDNIKSFIFKYKEYDLVGLNWLYFGNNYYHITPKGTILENYTKCQNKFNLHIKSLTKVNKIISNGPNPHYYKIKGTIIGVDYNMLNDNSPWFYDLQMNIDDTPGYIAHHWCHAYEIYEDRKINRIHDDGGCTKVRPPFSYDYMSSYNNIHNYFPRDKYNDINKINIELIVNNIKIKSIKYGNRVGKKIDITNEIVYHYLKSDNFLYIDKNINFNLIKGDPNPGIVKKLFLEYTCDNCNYIIEFDEYRTSNICIKNIIH